MNEGIFKKIKTYQIKPRKEFKEKEFLENIVHEMALKDECPTDIFDDLKFVKAELKYRNILAVTAKVYTSYQGSIGYKREEEYWDKEKKYSSNGSYYVDVKKTRTITDWHPYQGEDIAISTGCFDDWSAVEKDSYEKSNGLVYSERIYKLVKQNKLEVEELEFEINHDTFPYFDTMLTYCSMDSKVHLKVIYDSRIPGDEKNINYTQDILEYIEFECCRVPVYIVEYTYKDEKYKCYCDLISEDYCGLIPSAKPVYNIPTLKVSDAAKVAHEDAENETKNMRMLVTVLWGIAFCGLASAIALCFAHFYFGWIIVALLILLAIYFHSLYSKVWRTIFSNVYDDNTFNLRKHKLECLTAAIEEKRIPQLNDEKIEEFKAYVEEAKNERSKYTIIEGFLYAHYLKGLTIGSIIVLVIVTIFSFVRLNKYTEEYNHSPERISVEWVDKQNVSNDQLNITFEIESKKVEISKLVFELLVYKNGNKLGTLTTTCNDAELKAGIEKKFTFTWSKNGENTFFDEVKKSELSEFTYEIIITKIVFEDGYDSYYN